MDTPSSVPPVRHTWTAVQYPFLVIRVLPGVFSLRPLPRDLSVPALRALSWSAMEACGREFRMALVLGAGQALYLEPDGREHVERDIPWYQPLIDFDPPALAFLPGSGAATENPDVETQLPPTDATEVPSTEQSATPVQKPQSIWRAVPWILPALLILRSFISPA
jgi:hypothetical protein